MTALNQAFIKAYLRHGGGSVADDAAAAPPVPLDDVLQDSAQASRRSGRTASSDLVDDVAERPEALRNAEPAVEASPVRRVDNPKAPVEAATAAAGDAAAPSTPSSRSEADGPASPGSTTASSFVSLDALGFVGAGPGGEIGACLAVGKPLTGSRTETAGCVREDQPRAEVGTNEAPSAPKSQARAGTLQPMLRVDSVSWPRPSRRLCHAAGSQIDQLATAVCREAESGRNVIGVAGHSQGEGCTTVLLSVAQRLIAFGRNTLLVDGDVTQPDLPEQLGLMNERGWHDVAVGVISLEDVITQSDSESLSLLPYRGEDSNLTGPQPPENAVVGILSRIRESYDVVLIDFGGALTAGTGQAALAEKVAEQIDSVLTVQNVRTTTSSDLGSLRQRLGRLGIVETGIVENFAGN